ncbi:unnamed protein product [Nesidiocoris tenuis]|uniref:Lian-aa1 retrotransposon protein n=1 Tax=Nesidiocoris tenuis TaxID=355587 RepID=A0A6H5G7B0_9HEMI|nr:unnamed protein product [Nesidiocoris tenuis]
MRAVFASAYFAGDVQEVPPEDVCRLVSYCVNNNLQFVIGCDANAYNVVWGSTDTNTRGEELLNYIYSNRLEILNRGNIPTFVTRARSEVLDITLSSRNVAGRVWGWHVTDEVLSSDHRLISFKISFGRGEISTFRVSKNTDWPTYQEILNTEIEGLDRACNTPAEADSLADDLMNGIIRAYEASCPLVSGARRGSVPWWSCELENLRIRTRKLFNRAKNGGDWDTYKRSLTAYNKALRKARRSSWRNFCGGLEDVSAASKLQKVLSREGPGHISLLERADGSFTTSTQETLEVLMETHFPGSTVLPSGVSTPESDFSIPHRRELGRSRTIFTPERVKWAINSFKPFKSPGGDGVFPALLQRGLEVLSPLLIRLFCASYAMAYIPRAWRRVRVVFIPKAGGQPRSSAKGYRPISLMSFVLKTMEKILGHLLKEHFQLSPLNKAQHAYLKGRSTETALVEVTALIGKALEEKESAVGCFLDIGGAFDNTSYASIRNAAHKKGVSPPTIRWIMAMLSSREVFSEMGDYRVTVLANCGCPQGGVLSPLLWLLVADGLLTLLVEQGFEVVGYADDLAVIIRGRFDSTLSERVQVGLDLIQRWCDGEGLTLNPRKTTVVSFTRKRRSNVVAPTIQGTTLVLSEQVKYLGVILDRKLTWKPQTRHAVQKATKAMWACRRLMGKTWGISPRMAHWLYTAVVRPIVSYAALVWWRATNQQTVQAQLGTLQRQACLGITGAIRTCPTASMEVLLGLPPLHIHIWRCAYLGAVRVRWSEMVGSFATRRLQDTIQHFGIDSAGVLISDVMPEKMNFRLPFKVAIPSRERWRGGDLPLAAGVQAWYTDGSVIGGRTGLGVTGPRFSLALPLGSCATIFQAEVLAIDICAQELLRRGTKNARICIFSDSQAALKAISAFSHKSRLTWDCLNTLKALARDNRITLTWVLGHAGIKGNEKADSSAKLGAESLPTGPEPFLGLPKSYLERKVDEWVNTTKTSHWLRCPGLRQSKRLISPQGRARDMLSLSRINIRVLTGVLTGHCLLRYHLNKMGLGEITECRLCGGGEETAEHLLCDCPAAAYARFRHLGSGLLQPEALQRAATKNILAFLKEVGVFEVFFQ